MLWDIDTRWRQTFAEAMSSERQIPSFIRAGFAITTKFRTFLCSFLCSLVGRIRNPRELVQGELNSFGSPLTFDVRECGYAIHPYVSPVAWVYVRATEVALECRRIGITTPSSRVSGTSHCLKVDGGSAGGKRRGPNPDPRQPCGWERPRSSRCRTRCG